MATTTKPPRVRVSKADLARARDNILADSHRPRVRRVSPPRPRASKPRASSWDAEGRYIDAAGRIWDVDPRTCRSVCVGQIQKSTAPPLPETTPSIGAGPAQTVRPTPSPDQSPTPAQTPCTLSTHNLPLLPGLADMVARGLGAKRIHRRLQADGVDVSLRTVAYRVAGVRQGASDGF